MTKDTLSLERLSAYHDRELPPLEAARLRDELAGDAEARALLDSFDLIDDMVRASAAEELDAPVPLELARTVKRGFAARRRRAVLRTATRWAAPMAAAVALLVLGDQWMQMRIERALVERETKIAELTDKAVQTALETALSGQSVKLADSQLGSVVSVTPVRTYKSASQHWCREFVEEVILDGERVKRFGLACREKTGDWKRVETKMPGNEPPPVPVPLGRAL